MNNPKILLVDNGSVQPQATLNLRRLATELGKSSGQDIHPVSLQHADRIADDQLDGSPAQLMESFLSTQLNLGTRDFLVIPLFFGVSRALTSFIPGLVESLQSKHGVFKLQIGDVLYPLPQGEPRLAHILKEQLDPLISGVPHPRVILVDHGSPLREVTEVRLRIAAELRNLLPPQTHFLEAVMERREGSEYDFNGDRLEQVLEAEAQQDQQTPIAVSLLFLFPGRHAGQGGDIATICSDTEGRYPGLKIGISPLVGEHPQLLAILKDRLDSGLRAMNDV
ncbi:MAG: CbiX/SirB N-terminal domain-containing protein [Candidatus Thiodiazotropha sp.]